MAPKREDIGDYRDSGWWRRGGARVKLDHLFSWIGGAGCGVERPACDFTIGIIDS